MANRYEKIIEKIFEDHYAEGTESFEFDRDEIEASATQLEIALPKNVGDVIYSFRYRSPLPKSIRDTASGGREWVIKPAGRAVYRFEQVQETRIVPSQALMVTKIPDATPEIIARHALGDEQALLAKVRYNRLIDIFLGMTAYSLQNHLRTTVEGLGQIEIDEVYLGVDKHGAQYIIPVQAKGGNDQIGVVQAEQDLAWCQDRHPTLATKAIAAQFMGRGVIALFELTIHEGQIRVIQERHYKLVDADLISDDDLAAYRELAESE